jgi:hypothetical protein
MDPTTEGGPNSITRSLQQQQQQQQQQQEVAAVVAAVDRVTCRLICMQ